MLNYPLAVFLDTNVFIGCKYDLDENRYLNKLKKLVDEKKIELYISNIVLNETKKHITTEISNAVGILKKAKKDIKKRITPKIVEETSLAYVFDEVKPENIEEIAVSRFEDFLESSKVTILDNTNIDLDDVMESYFNSKPPFEQKEKKYEFPDALIISKLTTEFNEVKPIYVISSDKAFEKVLKGKKGFTCFKVVNELLDMINRQEEMYDAVKEYIQNEHFHIINGIENYLESTEIEVDGLDYDRKGIYSGYEYNYSILDSVKIETFVLETIDEIGNKNINLTILCDAEINATCYYDDFDNAFWDSDTKEYLFLREVHNFEEHNAEFMCQLKLDIDDKNDFTLSGISCELMLNQDSRVNRILGSDEEDDCDIEAERLEALEEFHKH